METELEERVKQLGFEDLAEFNHLVASVDLSLPDRMAFFRKWQDEDATKEGILRLITKFEGIETLDLAIKEFTFGMKRSI